jgi:hypothetical protein
MTARWSRDSRGSLSHRDWRDWLDRKDKSIDPYLVWADVAGGSGFATEDSVDQDAGHRWPFIIELASDHLPAFYETPPPHSDVPMIFGCIQIPGVYKIADNEAHPNKWTIDGKYVTALVHPEDIWHLMQSEVVVRAQLGLPRIRSADENRAPRPTPAGGADGLRVVVGLIDDGFGFAHERLLDSEGKPRVRYLWDQDVRREDGRWKEKGWKYADHLGYGAELGPEELERVVALRGDPWRPYRAVGYGRYRLDPETHSTAPFDADMMPIPIEAMVTGSHGQSVADLAAGYPSPRAGQTAPLSASLKQHPRPYEEAKKDVDGVLSKIAAGSADGVISDADAAQFDSADQWPVICVQLPVRTIADTSGGSLAVHVLDGIRYIVERARRIPYRRPLIEVNPIHTRNDVVINISYGAIAGGHDGTSILERAIADLVRVRPFTNPLWVVIADGNAYADSTHTSIEMAPGEDPQVLSWQIGPDNPLESYLEIWLPDRDLRDGKVPPETIQQIRIDVCAPGGERLFYAKAGEVCVLREGTTEGKSDPLAALIYPHRVVQSEHGTMILIAAAPTRWIGLGRPVAPHGEWIVTLSWDPGAQASGPRILVHAWSERSDLLFETSRGQQSHVFSDEPASSRSQFDPDLIAAWEQSQALGAEVGALRYAWPRFTMSSIASVPPARNDFTHQSGGARGDVVVVGAHRLLDGEVASLASGGPSRLATEKERWDQLQSRGKVIPEDGTERSRPDVTAPSEISPALPGLRTSGIQSATVARISETSAAAALVTRAIANVQFVQLDGTWDRSPLDAAGNIVFDENSRPSDSDDARPTLTPRFDDAFRAAKKRIR